MPVSRPIAGRRGLVWTTHPTQTIQPIAPRSGGEYSLKIRDAISGTEQTAMPAHHDGKAPRGSFTDRAAAHGQHPSHWHDEEEPEANTACEHVTIT